MAAYAAVVSLMTTVTMEKVPHHTFRLSSATTQLMESLYERASFLQEFLEGEWKGAKNLEARIVDAAQGAEGAIESYFADLESDAEFFILQEKLGMTTFSTEFLRSMRKKAEAMNGIADAAEESNIVNQDRDVEVSSPLTQNFGITTLSKEYLKNMRKMEEIFNRIVDAHAFITESFRLLQSIKMINWWENYLKIMRKVEEVFYLTADAGECISEFFLFVESLGMTTLSKEYLKKMPEIENYFNRIADEAEDINKSFLLRESVGMITSSYGFKKITWSMETIFNQIKHIKQSFLLPESFGMTTLPKEYLKNMHKITEVLNGIEDAAEYINKSFLFLEKFGMLSKKSLRIMPKIAETFNQIADAAEESNIVNQDLDHEKSFLLLGNFGMIICSEEFLRHMRKIAKVINGIADAVEDTNESNIVIPDLDKESLLLVQNFDITTLFLKNVPEAVNEIADAAKEFNIVNQHLDDEKSFLLYGNFRKITFSEEFLKNMRRKAVAINEIVDASENASESSNVNQDLDRESFSTESFKNIRNIAGAFNRIADAAEDSNILNEDIDGKEPFLLLEGFGMTIFSKESLINLRKKAEAFNRIADAAQDANEFNIWDCILSGSKRYDHLHQDLRKAIEQMDSIKVKAIQFKEATRSQHLLPRSSIPAAPSRVPPFTIKMVGFEDEKKQIIEELVSTDLSCKVFSIVGMGGAGKTTLTRNIYDDNYIVQCFDTRAWVTVSHEYNMGEIFREVLLGLGNQSTSCGDNLGEQVYRSLFGRRYLIVLDDIWSVECWNSIRRFFPDYNNGSRIMVTTRLSNLANQISTCSLDMKFLDENNSWALFCECVFVKESCPPELEEIGKRIVQKCKGIPLSLVVVGGLLRKSCMTFEYWKQVAEDVSSAISSNGGDLCLEILSSSYNHLPVYLKPCFLYMSVFPEDHEIRVFELYELWISEGFLKPIKGRSLKEIAENFLKDLIERNLIVIDKWGSRGNIKSCKIHDILRDLSIREAQKEKFFCIIGEHNVNKWVSREKIKSGKNHDLLKNRSIWNALKKKFFYVTRKHRVDAPSVMSSQCRNVFIQNVLKKNKFPQLMHSLQATQFTRSLVCNGTVRTEQADSLILPRLLSMVDKYVFDPISEGAYVMEDMESLQISSTTSQVKFQLAMNSRYLAYRVDLMSIPYHPGCQFRNMQTIVVRGASKAFTTQIIQQFWGMQHLRHIKVDTIVLPDGTFGWSDQEDYIVLKNLQTLQKVENFLCVKQTLKKIPNIRKLKISYREFWMACACLQNLVYLQKLESFAFFFHDYFSEYGRNELIRKTVFPHSLKKLTLYRIELLWEDMTMIGSLPHLEVLKLKFQSFKGRDWNPVEGEFVSLKFLHVERCNDLVNWNADRSHFPHLEQLFLVDLIKLKEIPLDIGEIPTLRLIQLQYCSDSAILSAKNILEEQESLGNEGLLVQVYCNKDEMKSLASENFHVHVPTW